MLSQVAPLRGQLGVLDVAQQSWRETLPVSSFQRTWSAKAPRTPGEGLRHTFLEDSVHLVGVAVLTASHPGPQLSSLPVRFLFLFFKFSGVTSVNKVA